MSYTNDIQAFFIVTDSGQLRFTQGPVFARYDDYGRYSDFNIYDGNDFSMVLWI